MINMDMDMNNGECFFTHHTQLEPQIVIRGGGNVCVVLMRVTPTHQTVHRSL